MNISMSTMSMTTMSMSGRGCVALGREEKDGTEEEGFFCGQQRRTTVFLMLIINVGSNIDKCWNTKYR